VQATPTIAGIGTALISGEFKIGTVITAQGSLITIRAEFHFRNNSMVYSVSRMWATGLSHPLLMHSAMINLYSRGHSSLTSKLALGTILMPSGENEKSASFERSVL
jgi:hypothetical protein